jgi:hypothetical protein
MLYDYCFPFELARSYSTGRVRNSRSINSLVELCQVRGRHFFKVLAVLGSELLVLDLLYWVILR